MIRPGLAFSPVSRGIKPTVWYINIIRYYKLLVYSVDPISIVYSVDPVYSVDQTNFAMDTNSLQVTWTTGSYLVFIDM